MTRFYQEINIYQYLVLLYCYTTIYPGHLATRLESIALVYHEL